MEFSTTFNESWNILGDQVRKFSARTSTCPDSPTELWCSSEFLTNSRSAVALLLILPMVVPSTRNFVYIESLRSHLTRMASQYSYEGDWKLVGEILSKSTSLFVKGSWDVVLETMNPNDFFGNLVPLMRNALRALKWRNMYTDVTKDKRPYRRPRRKRGYDDKGSRRLPHQWLPRIYLEKKKKVEFPVKEPKSFEWFGDLQRGYKGSG